MKKLSIATIVVVLLSAQAGYGMLKEEVIRVNSYEKNGCKGIVAAIVNASQKKRYVIVDYSDGEVTKKTYTKESGSYNFSSQEEVVDFIPEEKEKVLLAAIKKEKAELQKKQKENTPK